MGNMIYVFPLGRLTGLEHGGEIDVRSKSKFHKLSHPPMNGFFLYICNIKEISAAKNIHCVNLSFSIMCKSEFF